MPGRDAASGSLLSRLDQEIGGGPRAWSHLVMLRNTGPLVPGRLLQGDRISTRGSNAILLDRSGIPSHYLKMRSAWHERSGREAKLHVILAEHPEVKELVSPSMTFLHGPMRILACEFVHGERLDAFLRNGGRRKVWSETVGEVLAASRPFWRALRQVVGGGVRKPASTRVNPKAS